MKYKIWFRSGQSAREASSMDTALFLAREVLGVKRLYRGAEYVTDEPIGNYGDRRTCNGLDLWRSRKDAATKRTVSADCVVTW